MKWWILHTASQEINVEKEVNSAQYKKERKVYFFLIRGFDLVTFGLDILNLCLLAHFAYNFFLILLINRSYACVTKQIEDLFLSFSVWMSAWICQWSYLSLEFSLWEFFDYWFNSVLKVNLRVRFFSFPKSLWQVRFFQELVSFILLSNKLAENL